MSKTRFFSIAESPWEGSMTHLLQLADMQVVDSPEDADIIVFNGGADIGTEIYGELPAYQNIPRFKSERDAQEIAIYDSYHNTGRLMVGICRGGQLLNCLNGGTLWQDVNNHGRDHYMTVLGTRERMLITSTHHQMMRPNYETAKIIATSAESTRKVSETCRYDAYFETGVFPDDKNDTEIVWYPNTGSLCIQGHPEYVPSWRFANYCVDLIQSSLAEVKNVKHQEA